MSILKKVALFALILVCACSFTLCAKAVASANRKVEKNPFKSSLKKIEKLEKEKEKEGIAAEKKKVVEEKIKKEQEKITKTQEKLVKATQKKIDELKKKAEKETDEAKKQKIDAEIQAAESYIEKLPRFAAGEEIEVSDETAPAANGTGTNEAKDAADKAAK